MSVAATGKNVSEEDFIDLIRRAQQHEREAFDRLYDLFADRIYRYLYYRVGNQQLAEDLTADLFVRLIEKVHTLRLGQENQETVFSAWLFRIAHNLLVDHHRKRAKDKHEPLENISLAHNETPDLAVEAKLNREQLLEALTFLTAEQREVLVLRFLEELRTREVAGIMDKSEGAIKALQHRALNALQKQLAREAI